MTHWSFILFRAISGKQMHKWKRRKEQRPHEIMLAALTLFVEKGFAATKIEDIARQANVSKGTVYLYYASKQNLFQSMVHELMIPKISEVEEYIASYKGSHVELLKIVALQWWQTVKTSGLTGVPRLIICEADKFPDLTRFYVKEVIHRIQNILVNIIKSGIRESEFRKINPVLSARAILSSLVYFSMWDISLKKYDQPDIDVEQLIKQQLDIVINGIKK